jgi:uncharacterized phiE125 gp8 family phage protein
MLIAAMLRLIEKPDPSTPVLTLEEAKAYLEHVDDDHDDMLRRLIAAATERFDGRDGLLGRALHPQTWELVRSAFPAREIELPLPPTLQILSIFYLDGNVQEQELTEDDDFRVIPGGWEGHVVVPSQHRSWPATAPELDAVRIRFRAGYELVDGKSTVPEQIRQMIGLTVNTWFAHREQIVTGTIVAKIPDAVLPLVDAYRDPIIV